LHALAEGSVRPSPPETLPELERKSILQALREEDWRVEAAARRLGIPRSTLYYRLKAMGIPLRRSDPSNS
jgi:transcriptional regulator of acetoin/glycerol metabolism